MIGGPFPATPASAIYALSGEADVPKRTRALERVATYYYAPVYRYLRVKHQRGHDDARDLAQDFFLSALERGTFASYDPRRARFRTFVRTCIDRLVIDNVRAAGAKKRGGDRLRLDVDWDAVDPAVPEGAGEVGFEDYFEREWTKRFFDLVVEALRARCANSGKLEHFALFEAYALEAPEIRPSYVDLASRHGIKVTDVTNRLSYMRGQFRRIALAMLREVTASDEEFRDEAKRMLGVAL